MCAFYQFTSLPVVFFIKKGHRKTNYGPWRAFSFVFNLFIGQKVDKKDTIKTGGHFLGLHAYYQLRGNFSLVNGQKRGVSGVRTTKFSK